MHPCSEISISSTVDFSFTVTTHLPPIVNYQHFDFFPSTVVTEVGTASPSISPFRRAICPILRVSTFRASACTSDTISSLIRNSPRQATLSHDG
jgi:hypothetical protein